MTIEKKSHHHRPPRHYHRHYRVSPGSFFLGILAGGATALAAAAIADLTLDEARNTYKSETNESMPLCSDIPPEKYARDNKGNWLCSNTSDEKQICFYKNGNKDGDNKACYIP